MCVAKKRQTQFPWGHLHFTEITKIDHVMKMKKNFFFFYYLFFSPKKTNTTFKNTIYLFIKNNDHINNY